MSPSHRKQGPESEPPGYALILHGMTLLHPIFHGIRVLQPKVQGTEACLHLDGITVIYPRFLAGAGYARFHGVTDRLILR